MARKILIDPMVGSKKTRRNKARQHTSSSWDLWEMAGRRFKTGSARHGGLSAASSIHSSSVLPEQQRRRQLELRLSLTSATRQIPQDRGVAYAPARPSPKVKGQQQQEEEEEEKKKSTDKGKEKKLDMESRRVAVTTAV
ncbi:uncharacterized protein MONBRDRAFT_5564 [Monosiga brevicollis MX1]|uniref:Uncharacterized protein n=1 Tax=Monosiga brevicollis TaxID=81824 RepID=A9URU0_MONBE|nr:uncharacterized protein MONBRDRAFT_5564 [Monosiga brevicollis MX1]EDQ91984.1 predicted protein [Monosiga brevicollis MX1]|eukprot:XP_001743270.1 hypothetical protein [Monosiga brevicollis MX1]